MDQNRRGNDERPSRGGFVLAVVLSAIAHAGLFYLVLIIVPKLLSATAPPPSYTVKIVDSLPAGDLGTHLPRLNRSAASKPPPKPQAVEAEPNPPAPAPAEHDETVIALNTKRMAQPTPTPTPPKPLAELATPTSAATPRPRKHPPKVIEPTPAATPTPARAGRHHLKPSPAPVVVAAATPGVSERLEKVRQQLLAERLRQIKSGAENEEHGHAGASGGGPAAAEVASMGRGYGVGANAGSAGIQQDPAFLLYYQEVQKRIRGEWSFAGDNPDLTATVTFGINPDGSLNSINVTTSSRDPSFDDSVVRAIRRAAPFPPPPEKYRTQFAEGLPAIFKLGELQSAGG